MKKLTGWGEKKEMVRLVQVKARARAAARAMALPGRWVKRRAIAAGVTIRAKIRRTPTTWTASVTASARMAMNAMERAVTGTPLAAARVSSTELKSSGR